MEKSDRSSLTFPIWTLAVLAIGMLMHAAAGICLWIATSFFLFVLLDPFYLELKRRRVPKLAAAISLILISVFICAAIVFFLFHFSSNIVAELEDTKRILLDYYGSFSKSFSDWISSFSHSISSSAPSVNGPGKPLPKVQMVESSPFSGGFGITLMHGLGSAITVLTFAALWPILAFFFLSERDSLAKVIRRVFPHPELADRMWLKIVASTRAFFLGNLILALVSFPIFLLLFVIFSVKSPFTQAALASFFNIVPFVGAMLAGLLPSLALLSQTESLGATIGLYGCCMGVHFIIANFVTPKLLGARVDINAATSTIALLVWGELWGGLGLLLAIPLTSVIKVMLENSGSYWARWFAALMSAKYVDEVLEGAEMKKRKAAI